jgi:hypothetical protein
MVQFSGGLPGTKKTLSSGNERVSFDAYTFNQKQGPGIAPKFAAQQQAMYDLK